MKVVAIVAALAAVVAALWALFMLVFNVIVHDVFHGPAITFWQAGACVVLIGFVTQGLRAVRA